MILMLEFKIYIIKQDYFRRFIFIDINNLSIVQHKNTLYYAYICSRTNSCKLQIFSKKNQIYL